MTYPLVQFVSAPDVDADVRFDFNTAGQWSDDETWPQHDGFTLGVPSLEGDPDAYGVQYGLRQLEFNVIISAAYADASRLWSQLAKELVGRRTNWLLFQFSPFSRPVWFKTYRTAPDALDFEQVDDTDDASSNLWGLGVQLAAEPFAYGERVTLPALTVANNPAAATNPCSAVLPEILGDAPAAARFDMTVATLHDIPSPMFGVTPVDDSAASTTLYQFGTSDGALLYVDAAAPVSSSTFTGLSYRPVTFASNDGMVRRVGMTVNVRPGRYAVLLRAARSDNSTHFAVKAVPNRRVDGPVVTMDRPAAPTSGYAQWMDLGTFTLPAGLADFDAGSMLNTVIEIHAQRTAGSGQLYLDALVLVPVEHFDGEPGFRLTTLPDFLGDSASGYVNRWDGDAEFHQIYKNGAAVSANPAVLAGQFPVLTPGRTNLFHLFRQTSPAAREDGTLGDVRGGSDNTDAITMSTTVTISYHPRWLWLAGS